MNTITNIHYLNLRNVYRLSQLQQPLLRSEGRPKLTWAVDDKHQQMQEAGFLMQCNAKA